MRQKQQIDWIGRWYEIGRERGVSDVFSIGRMSTHSTEVEWSSFHHAQMDGAGAMTHLLREIGLSLPRPPIGRVAKRPSLWQALGIIRRTLKEVGPSRVVWKEQRESMGSKPHLAWIVFTQDETAQINAYTKARGLSQNSYLLAHLNSEIFAELLAEDQPGKWLFPINMRPAIDKLDPSTNHSSAIYIAAKSNTTPEEIHSQIREKIKANIHWGLWWIYHVGWIIGKPGMRVLSRRAARKSHHIGTFSNMGNWPPPGSDSRCVSEDEVFVATAPGTPNYPLGIVCITWHGKLALTLKVHPSICGDEKVPAVILERLRARVGCDVKSLPVLP